MSDVYAIYGSGGYAREVMPLLQTYVGMITQTANSEIYFIDDFADSGSVVNGSTVYPFDDFVAKFADRNVHCCVAIADKNVREKLTNRCLEHGFKMTSVQASNCVTMDAVELGEGSVLSPFVTITSNVTIGKSFHANIYSYVAHDCVIGDFVTFAPAVKCNGNVHIKSGVYVGTGAIIHPGTKDKPIVIGANSKVAAGAVVTKSVPDNVTVIGNPAQVLTRELLRKLKNNA